MKKYFIIALLLFEVSLNAQFTVAKSDNTPLTNGHILSFNSIVYAQAALALKITNTNANTINLKLKCTALTNTDGSLMEVCFGPDCTVEQLLIRFFLLQQWFPLEVDKSIRQHILQMEMLSEMEIFLWIILLKYIK